MNYYQFPQFPQPYYPMYPQQTQQIPQPAQPYQDEQSYIENILRLNLGKMVSVYMNFENSQWGSKVFKGKLEAAGKDHIIISDPLTGIRYLLLSIYLDYITFDEEINYYYPYQQNIVK
jgi:spore germination protein Q